MSRESVEKTDQVCVALVTCPSEKQARDMAEAVIQDELAACVNIVPAVKSLYVWEGKLQEETEALMIIKTTRPRIRELESAVKTLHSYTVPEFIVLPLVDGSADYLGWVAGATDQKLKDSV